MNKENCPNFLSENMCPNSMFYVIYLICVFIANYCVTDAKSILNRYKLKQHASHNNLVECTNLPATILSDVMGAAFNSRYMSIEKPVQSEESKQHEYNIYNTANTGKRSATSEQPFYVDDTYTAEVSGDRPAWEVTNFAMGTSPISGRPKREIAITNDTSAFRDWATDIASRYRQTRGRDSRHTITTTTVEEKPWKCEGQIKWLDLGPDYFPRYLRSVECVKEFCWYGHFACMPKSFTVKLLRRRRGKCVPSERTNHRVGVAGLPGDLRELWVWEERAVNFCCECAMP